MQTLRSLIQFLDDLEEKGIFYELKKVRDSIMIEVSIPGQRWEVEFMKDGTLQIEKFLSDGSIADDESQLEALLREWGE